MKKECEQKACSELKRDTTRMNGFTRLFRSLGHSSVDASCKAILSVEDEAREATQAFQLEAEQKRALGIMYYRRDVGR
jgi:hypothetical protein